MKLVSIVLSLSASGEDNAVIPSTIGKAAHAAFFGLLAKIDQGMATRLHNAFEKPFSISFSQEGSVSANPLHQPDQGYWLRITSLDGELSRLLLESATELSALGTLRLFGMKLEVAKVSCHPKEHPWAGQSTYEELYNNGVAMSRRKEKAYTIGLRFASPTAFRLVDSRLNMPLPWPRLVFQSLAEKWNAFSPIPLWLNWPAFDRQVSIAHHRLETQVLDFGRYRQVGFVGECWYLLDRSADLKLRQALHALADFAFYAGVGRKTTMGMGLVRRIDERKG